MSGYKNFHLNGFLRILLTLLVLGKLFAYLHIAIHFLIILTFLVLFTDFPAGENEELLPYPIQDTQPPGIHPSMAYRRCNQATERFPGRMMSAQHDLWREPTENSVLGSSEEEEKEKKEKKADDPCQTLHDDSQVVGNNEPASALETNSQEGNEAEQACLAKEPEQHLEIPESPAQLQLESDTVPSDVDTSGPIQPVPGTVINEHAQTTGVAGAVGESANPAEQAEKEKERLKKEKEAEPNV